MTTRDKSLSSSSTSSTSDTTPERPTPQETVIQRISHETTAIRYRLDGHDETLQFSTVNDANKVWELLARIYNAIHRQSADPGEGASLTAQRLAEWKAIAESRLQTRQIDVGVIEALTARVAALEAAIRSVIDAYR